MTHSDHRTTKAQREDCAEFGNDYRSPDALPGAGIFFTAILAAALIGAGAWMAFG